MNNNVGKEVCEFSTLESTTVFKAFLDRKIDIEIRSHKYGEEAHDVITNEAGHFVKWIKQNNDSYSVEIPIEKDKLVLRGGEIIIPLIFLSSQVGLPVFLNMVSNYLYERFKGSLSGDKDHVEIEVIAEDTESGKSKRFKYKGSYEGYLRSVKKFNLDKFMED